ncbi:hypothetical protein WG66_014384 [Moniliophthora roreri]|nr:hypothetical protein WG66_014384 [Moniliophthora roreri]
MIEDLGYTKSVLVALWGKGKGAPINKPLLVTAIVLYTLCTAHVINDLGRAIAAFIDHGENDPGGAKAYYAQLRVWSSIFRQAIYVTNNNVADALLVYRLYVIWNYHVKIIIGPILLLLATAVCGYRAVWGFSNIREGEDTYAREVFTWGLALFALSLLLNLIVTTLIAGRLWWCGKRMTAALGRRVESGAIYSVCVFMVLITFVVKTNGAYIVYNALAQVVGMNPFLIIVRVGLGLSAHDSTARQTTARNMSALAFSSEQGQVQGSDTLSVHVHCVTQTKADDRHEDAEELDISQASKLTWNHPESQNV